MHVLHTVSPDVWGSTVHPIEWAGGRYQWAAISYRTDNQGSPPDMHAPSYDRMRSGYRTVKIDSEALAVAMCVAAKAHPIRQTDLSSVSSVALCRLLEAMGAVPFVPLQGNPPSTRNHSVHVFFVFRRCIMSFSRYSRMLDDRESGGTVAGSCPWMLTHHKTADVGQVNAPVTFGDGTPSGTTSWSRYLLMGMISTERPTNYTDASNDASIVGGFSSFDGSSVPQVLRWMCGRPEESNMISAPDVVRRTAALLHGTQMLPGFVETAMGQIERDPGPMLEVSHVSGDVAVVKFAPLRCASAAHLMSMGETLSTANLARKLDIPGFLFTSTEDALGNGSTRYGVVPTLWLMRERDTFNLAEMGGQILRVLFEIRAIEHDKNE